MDRTLYPVKALNNSVVILAGTLNTENTSDPTVLKGKGFTASRPGVGTLRVTFNDVLPEVLSLTCTGEVALTSVWSTTSNVSILDITLTGGDVADKQVNFCAVVQNSKNPAT